MKKNIILITALIFAFWGCDKDRILDPPFQSNQVITQMPDTTKAGNSSQITGNHVQGTVLFEFNDFDGNVYHAIQIGNQVWSQENLKTTHYNDGTPIPCITETLDWAKLKSGAYCHYKNDALNSEIYGMLYNYYAVATKKLAPKGWHVATTNDWETLLSEVEIVKPNYDIDVGPLVDAKDWHEPLYVLNRNYEEKMVSCTNSTGFTALPNGYRDILLSYSLTPDREFDCLGVQASWWTSSGRIIYVDGSFGIFPSDDTPYNVGSGVRIVKDTD